jgi:hypothetical protein
MLARLVIGLAARTAPYPRGVDGSTYRDFLKPIFGERRVILVGGVVTAWTATVPLVRGLGATDVLVIGTEGTGAGPLPDPAEATVLALRPPPATSILDGIHAGLARLRDPPAEVVDAVRRLIRAMTPW